VGEELCPALGIAIPVGKDSLSMKTTWREGEETRSVVAPVSLIVSAFAPVGDVRKTLTPELRNRSRRFLQAAQGAPTRHSTKPRPAKLALAHRSGRRRNRLVALRWHR